MQGSQLAARIYTTNGAPTVSAALARMHAIRECIHSGLISTRQRRVRETGREGDGRGGGGGYLLEWHSANTNSMSVSKTPERVCGAVEESKVAERSACEACDFKSIPPNN